MVPLRIVEILPLQQLLAVFTSGDQSDVNYTKIIQ